MLALRDRAVREVVSAMVPGTPWGGYHLVQQGWERQLAALEVSGPAGGRVAYWLGWAEEELEGGETGEARTSLVEARLALLEAEEALGETLEVAQRASRGGVEAVLGWGRSAVVYRARRSGGGLCALKVSRAGEAARARVGEAARWHRWCSGLSAIFPVFFGEERVEDRLCVWMEEAIGEALQWTRRGSHVLERGALEWLAEEVAGLRGQGVLLRHGGVSASRIVIAGSGEQAWLLPSAPAASGAASDEEALREVLAGWGVAPRAVAGQASGARGAAAGVGSGLARRLRGGGVGAEVLEEALARLHVEPWCGESEPGEVLLALAQLRPEVLASWSGLRGAVLGRVRCALREVGGRRDVSPRLRGSLEAAAASLESEAPPGVEWWVEMVVEGRRRIVVREAQLSAGVTVGRGLDVEVRLPLRSLARRHFQLKLAAGGVSIACYNVVELEGHAFWTSRLLEAGAQLRVEGLEVGVRRGIAPRGALAPRPALASRWVLWETLGVEPNVWSVWGWDVALERRVLVQVGTSSGAPASGLERARRRQEAAAGSGVSPVLGWGEVDGALGWGEVECCVGSPFLVLDVGGAETLAQRAALRRLGWAEVASCGAQLGRVLRAAHGRGVLHGALHAERVAWEEATGRVEVFGFGLREVLTWYDPERWMRLDELEAIHRPETAVEDVRALGRLLAVLGGVEVAPEAGAGEALEALRRGEAPAEVAEALAACFGAGEGVLARVVQGLGRFVGEEVEEVGVTQPLVRLLCGASLEEAAPLSWEEGLAVGLHLVEALAALVEAGERLGWLSPQQVVLEGAGGEVRATLVELESSRVGVSPMRAAASWGYAPPEVLRDALGAWDAERAAVYQVGALLFFAWTGAAPFGGDTPLSVVAKVLTGLEAAMESAAASRLDARAQGLLRGALARDPARRWGGLGALRAALRGG